MKAAFKRGPLARWPVLQRCNQTGKCSDMPSACWQKSKGLEARGIDGVQAYGNGSWKVQKWIQKSTTRRIPRWSPSQVLTPPYRTWLRWSDENRYFPCGVVVDEGSRWKVAPWLKRCVKPLRGQASKWFDCGGDEVAITSRLPNEGTPKLARSSNTKRGVP